MPTENPRINITTNKKLYAFLSEIAEKEEKSLSALARDLIIEALDEREDRYLSKLADERMKEDDGKWIKHEDVDWDALLSD